MYVQPLKLLLMAKFHAQIWEFWNFTDISETNPRIAKGKLNSKPWGRKCVYVQLHEILAIAKFHAQIRQY